jgi:hypothetical protein
MSRNQFVLDRRLVGNGGHVMFPVDPDDPIVALIARGVNTSLATPARTITDATAFAACS